MSCIYNTQGKLQCNEHFSQQIPNGSYQQSCGFSRFPCFILPQDNVLICACLNEKRRLRFNHNGRPIATRLDLDSCINPQDIENQNGKLTCIPKPSPPQPSQGPCPADIRKWGTRACTDNGYTI